MLSKSGGFFGFLEKALAFFAFQKKQ